MPERAYRIVHEDGRLIVVDKPSGMLVIPTPKGETNTLTDLLNRDLDGRGIEVNAYPCHRIDRETSGLVLFGKGKAAQGELMDEFKRRAVKKRYVAFVHGRVKRAQGVISFPIHDRGKNRNEEAVTNYRVTELKKNFSIVEVAPVTGRTNQIRIHFKMIAHPLVGESVYAFRKDYALKFRRVALHAALLEFTDPATKQRLSFSSPLPADMERFLREHG